MFLFFISEIVGNPENKRNRLHFVGINPLPKINKNNREKSQNEVVKSEDLI